MKRLSQGTLIVFLLSSMSFAQDLNKIVFGPLEGDDAGVLTVLNGEAIEIEMWVRTDPGNPTPLRGILHGLLSDDQIIAVRNGVAINPEYDMPNWEIVGVEGPYTHNPDDDYPIPVGYTCEMQYALCGVFQGCTDLDTEGDWEYYGAFLMTCNTDIPTEQIYYPFSMGWYPQSGQGTAWAFDVPPGGSVVPDQEYCGLYFAPECDYVPGDCNHNGEPWELGDIVTMIALYRGVAVPPYTCYCPPHGEDFPPDADPDGDCVPFELSDVLIMFGMPPEWPHGCLDCPPPGWLDGGKSEKTRIAPTLKSKARIKEQIKSEALK